MHMTHLSQAVMGKRKHSRHDSSDSESDDSRPSGSESEGKRRKKDKKEKKYKHKKHKKKEHKDKDKERLMKEAKKFLKQKLKQGDPQAALAAANAMREEAPAHTGDVVPISNDDYYSKNPEFAVWLRDTRNIFFSELNSEQAHALFPEFVAAWNGRKLASKFYTGTAASTTQRTGFKWSFKGGVSRADQGSLGMAAAVADDVKLKDEERTAAKDQQKHRQEEREWLDEVAPKATGREALVEKKMARREAAKAREDSPELMRVTGGGDLMGGDDSFQAAKAREARRGDWRQRQQAVRQEAVQAKLAQAQAEEDAKLDRFRALLAQGPLQIQKRQ